MEKRKVSKLLISRLPLARGMIGDRNSSTRNVSVEEALPRMKRTEMTR